MKLKIQRIFNEWSAKTSTISMRTALIILGGKIYFISQISFVIFLIKTVVLVLILAIGLIVGLVPGGSEEGVDAINDENGYFNDVNVTYDSTKPWTYHRLPRIIIPSRYNLSIYPLFYNNSDNTFEGNVTIDAHVMSGTRYIILHSSSLNITNATVQYYASIDGFIPANQPEVKSVFTFEPYKYLVILLKKRLRKETDIKISIQFSGNISSSYNGFYRSHFTDPVSGEKQFVAMTLFEPLNARLAFPCFDEPDMKAHFAISIRHRSDFKALSNMPPKHQLMANDTDEVITQFQTTSVPMSTYLVAWVIGQYESLPSVTIGAPSSNVTFTIQVPRYALEQTRYAQTVAVTSFNWFQRYFATVYPLPKLDFIVLPEFKINAMENWGLIAFREESLLTTTESSEADKDRVVSIITHELAHLWVGNFVTMEWWNDLWMKEGISTYLEYQSMLANGRAVNSEEYRDFLNAMANDGYQSSRPVRRQYLTSISDISENYDSNTNQKAAALIRMLNIAIGYDRFRHGMQDFMHRYGLGNANMEHLWQSIDTTTEIKVPEVMSDWFEEKGFPLLTTELGVGGDELVVTQEPFIHPLWVENGGVTEEQMSTRWWIPITVKSENPNEKLQIKWFSPSKTVKHFWKYFKIYSNR